MIFRVAIWMIFIATNGFTLFKSFFFSPINVTKWVVQKGGSLQVDGSTNINTFTCKITDYSNPDTISVTKNTASKDVHLPMNGTLKLNINSFNCGMAVMTHDLRKTLKAKEFPIMAIRFLTLSKLPEPNTLNNDITGWVEIELAGVKRKFSVNYTFAATANKGFHLKGTQHINFSDFELTPPRKLGGMIKANERLDVEFELNLAAII